MLIAVPYARGKLFVKKEALFDLLKIITVRAYVLKDAMLKVDLITPSWTPY
jgi:hypothetical protein